MSSELPKNYNVPLLSWDIFCGKYNALMEAATMHRQSEVQIVKIAKDNKWTKTQTTEAIENINQFVIIITDTLQRISFTGKGFYEMTGYTFEEAKGRTPKFLQGPATNKMNTGWLKKQLNYSDPTEIVLENYRKSGELYLCKILIKPIININKKLVNYIAYEQEITS